VLRLALAVLHLLGLAIGFGAVWGRAAALHQPPDATALRRALRLDTAWGAAAMLWIGTGLWRYLGGIEKATTYYNHNPWFLAKMTLLGAILALEVWPMATLIRWRVAIGRGTPPAAVAPAATARRIATLSYVQAVLVALMVVAAVAMARGYGA
jgi:putative membrane protein